MAFYLAMLRQILLYCVERSHSQFFPVCGQWQLLLLNNLDCHLNDYKGLQCRSHNLFYFCQLYMLYCFYQDADRWSRMKFKESTKKLIILCGSLGNN